MVQPPDCTRGAESVWGSQRWLTARQSCKRRHQRERETGRACRQHAVQGIGSSRRARQALGSRHREATGWERIGRKSQHSFHPFILYRSPSPCPRGLVCCRLVGPLQRSGAVPSRCGAQGETGVALISPSIDSGASLPFAQPVSQPAGGVKHLREAGPFFVKVPSHFHQFPRLLL